MHGGEAETTNNRMELTAAIEALNALKSASKVTLHTDSKYVMDGINEWMPNWKKRGCKTSARMNSQTLGLMGYETDRP
jgi:ribonuclease HI